MWPTGDCTITQAEASIAGGVIALQGEVSLQEPTSSQALQWRLAGIHLDQLLGPAFQPVTIAEATGRLTNQGDGLVLETSVQMPMFALAPGTLGQRQPHLTHVALTCTLQLHAALHTPGHGGVSVARRRSAVVAARQCGGPRPRAPAHVAGRREPCWIIGRRAGARGAGAVPRSGACGWTDHRPLQKRGVASDGLAPRAISSERFVFDDTFTEVHTTVVKSADQIEIADLRARRGTGQSPRRWRLAARRTGGRGASS